MLFVLLCCLVALCQGVLGEGDYHINNASGLIEFSKNVNSGTSFKGTTVFLDADIDFSGGLSEQQFEPIGKSDSNTFQGTFNGQGHTISNLAMNFSSSWYVGLFGYSYGATIRNVVLDSSCSVLSSYSDSSNVNVGGVIGYCQTNNGLCTIENTVNMAGVAFTGNISSSLYLSGIVGYLYASNKEAIVRNCANYGSVTHSRTAGYAYIGGIIGCSYGISSSKVFIQNSLNYGTITHSGTTSNNLYLGGILGSTYGTHNIENCVSGGKVTSNKQAKYNCIGNVVGYINSGTATITHCYWTSVVENYSVCGNGIPTIVNETKKVSLNATTMDSLNSYNSSWNKWLMLYLNEGSINDLNQSSLVTTGKHFSDPVKEGNAFLSWCLDTECDEKYDPKTTDITKVSELYAQWSPNNYTVTLNVNGGDILSVNVITVTYGQSYNYLPNATRTGYTFTGWFTEENGGIEVTNETTANIIAGNHTLYAHWIINNYTITFDFGNGTIVNETLTFNETIIYPKNLTKEGHTFNRWKPKPETMPAEDTTVVAQWTVNPTEYVEIVFGKKDMTREEVKEVIKKYTNEEFSIVRFEENKNGETKIIIKFNDAEKAKNFVDAIKESSGVDIVSINFLSEPLSSAASKVSLFMIFGLMLL